MNGLSEEVAIFPPRSKQTLNTDPGFTTHTGPNWIDFISTVNTNLIVSQFTRDIRRLARFNMMDGYKITPLYQTVETFLFFSNNSL